MLGRIATFLRGNVVALLALFVALGGTSYAVTGGFVTKSGQLSGCVGTSGTLKLLKPGRRCAKGQKPVAWNVAGPTGAQGRVGAVGASGTTGATGAVGQGVTGSIGPIGPSDAYANKERGKPITLSVGDYVIFARATWENDNGDLITLRCKIWSNAEIVDQGEQDAPAAEAGHQTTANVTLVGTQHLSHNAEAVLICEHTASTFSGTYLSFELTAVRVGALHEQ
jgi:hypothetical protein